MRLQAIEELLAIGECEWIDFKEIHHTNKADLIHDILCLANANHNGDRYLVFGIRDIDHAIVGFEPGAYRRSPPDLINLFQSIRMNQVPYLKMSTVLYSNHEIDLLLIKDMPERPYFLLQDYLDGRERVRAGAVYLRVGDTNTPKDRTADDVRVEQMYRQRFGIDRPPLERVRTYLKDHNSWQRDYVDGTFFRYEPFPEFTLISAGLEEDNDFDEPWVRVFPDERGKSEDFYLKYHGTVLARVTLIWCDGGRYVTAIPETWENNSTAPADNRQSFYFLVDSFAQLVSNLVQHHHPDHFRSLDGPGISVFVSREEAAKLLQSDLEAGVREYVFYRLDQSSKEYYRIYEGREREAKGHGPPRRR